MEENQPNQSTWQIDNDQSIVHDPLLECLLITTQLLHRPFSKATLTAGLPLTDGCLTPDLLIRAAKRAGLSAKLNPLALDAIEPTFFPAILLLHNQQACIVQSVNEQGIFNIIQPRSGGGTMTIDAQELANQYTGYCFIIQPEFQFEPRTATVPQSESKHWFWDHILKQLPIYSEVLVASCLINLFALASPLFAMNVYDRVVPNYALATLWVLAIGVFIVYCFDFIMRLLRGHFIDSASKHIDASLSNKIFEHMLSIRMASRPKSVGTMANMVHAFEAFRDFITSTTISILIDVPFTLIFIAVIWIIAGPLALIPLAAIPIIIAIGLLVQLPLNRLVQKSYRYATEKQATLIESLHGIETIKILNAEGNHQKRWEQVVSLAAALGAKLRLLASIGVNAAILSQNMCNVLMILFGVYAISRGELSMGGLIACTILTNRALAPMTQVASLLTRYYQSVTALNSVDQLMQASVERPKGYTPLQRSKPQGGITFQNVSFTYPQQSVPALNNVSFQIKPGERVGIIGRIGSGKTTIQKLLMGLYQPTAGNILIDSTDLQQLDIHHLRDYIGYVPQDINLFYGTVKDNISMGKPLIQDADILQAAKISGLDEFIERHPDGFDLTIEEHGRNLSGGQRQMIAITRACLNHPPILLLDEPTSAMDDKSDVKFKQQLMHALGDRTLILVTHRASMLSLVDRLIILDQGHITADGPKTKILQALTANTIQKTQP